MIDARVAANMLLMLEPKIVEAKAVLEAASELQAIVEGAKPQVAPSPEPTDVGGKTAAQFVAEMEKAGNADNDHKEPAAGPAGGG